MDFGQIEKEWLDWQSISIYPLNELPEHLLHHLRQEQARINSGDRLSIEHRARFSSSDKQSLKQLSSDSK